MSTSDFELPPPPSEPRKRELWLQHAAGFIMFQDAREYALRHIDPKLDSAATEAAKRAVDDAIYGMMMIIDGVTGQLRGGGLQVDLQMNVRLTRVAGREVIQQLDLFDGDGVCMGFHMWRDGNFGDAQVATPLPEKKASLL